MSLAEYQRTIKKLLMTPEGKAALTSKDHLMPFLKQSRLSQQDKAQLATQSLARLKQYDFMLLANAKDNIRLTLPYTYDLIGEDWDELMLKFFWEYPAQSYRLLTTSQPFAQFIEKQEPLMHRHPYLAELAFFEWVEVDLLSAPEPVYPEEMEELIPLEIEGLDAFAPILNPCALALHFEYPIHELIQTIQKTSSPAELVELLHEDFIQKPVSIWLFRKYRPYYCLFLLLDPILEEWLETVKQANLQGYPLSYRAAIEPILECLSKNIPDLDRSTFYETFLQVFERLFDEGIIAGSLPLFEL